MRLRAAATTLAALVTTGLLSNAQDPVLPPAETVKAPTAEETQRPRGMPPFVWFAEYDSSYSSGADFDRASGGFSSFRSRFAAGFFAKIDETTRLGMNVSYSIRSFNFQNNTTILAGTSNPWRRIQQSDLNVQFFHDLSDRWTLTFTGGFGLNHEDGASTADAFQFRTFAGARFRVLGNLHLVPGFFVQSRIEERPIAFPVIGFEWDIDDTFRLELQRSVALSAALSEKRKLELRLEGEWNLDRFRLDDSGTNPDGIGSVRDNRVGLGLRWKPQPFIDVSFFSGVTLGREIRVETPRGRRIFRDDVDPALQLNLSARISF